MESLDMKRARLRLELQEAYSAWLQITEAWANAPSPQGLADPSGCPDLSGHPDLSGSPKATQAEWFEYLAAKERLVQAYAEQSAAA